MKSKSGVFRTFSILSYIANTLSAIVLLWFLLACLINGLDQLKDTSLANFFGGGLILLAIGAGVLCTASILSIVGVAKMRRGKRTGFFLYAISNGLWVLIVFYGASAGNIYLLIMGGISSLFIAYFALRLPKLS